MSEPIAIIPKNPIDEIRVAWREFKGTPRDRTRRAYRGTRDRPATFPLPRALRV